MPLNIGSDQLMYKNSCILNISMVFRWLYDVDFKKISAIGGNECESGEICPFCP